MNRPHQVIPKLIFKHEYISNVLSRLRSWLLAHLFVFHCFHSLIHDVLCVKKMNINYLILPQAIPQLCFLTPESFDFWVTFCGPFLESKFNFNVIAVAKALRSSPSLNMYLKYSDLFPQLLFFLCK